MSFSPLPLGFQTFIFCFGGNWHHRTVRFKTCMASYRITPPISPARVVSEPLLAIPLFCHVSCLQIIGPTVASLNSTGMSTTSVLIWVPWSEASLYKIPWCWYKGFCRSPVDSAGRRVSGKEGKSIYRICIYSHQDKALPHLRWK